MVRNNRLSRRTLAGALTGTLAALPLLARPALSQPRPLRIGLLASLSGPYAALGESLRAGLALQLRGAGATYGGRPVELLVEDDAARPEEGIRKARKLAAQDRVDLLCGVISSAVALALRDVVTELKVPTFMLGSANALAREAASPWVVRPTKTNWMLGSCAARWAASRFPGARVLTAGSDYAAGREFVGDFATGFEGAGGRIGRQFWVPLGNADFGPVLTTIASEKPDLVYGFFAGADAVRFLRQWKDYRLAGRVQLLGPGAFFDQEDVLPAVGDAAIGAVNAFQQSPTAPASAAFAAAYVASGRRVPGEFGTSGFVTGEVVRGLAERASGDFADWEKVRDGLFAAPLDTAFGPLRFDARNNQAILDVHVNEVRRGPEGTALNTVVHTYAQVRDPGPTA